MKKKAVIFGITGQDGSYMLELLLKKNYEVHGLIRKSATGNTKNINHCVHFIGWRNDIRDIYKNSDIYISTSYSESFPDAVREAMLASLPVIVTDVGGTRELVDIGKNGYLFEPGDIRMLSFFLRKLVSSQSIRQEMGLASKRIIEAKFSTKVYASEFEKMLDNMILK